MFSYILLFLSLLALQIQCVRVSEVTFQNTVVVVVELNQTRRETVTGCISEQSFLLKNPARIVIKEQTIPVLHSGAVSNISYIFGLDIVNNSITTIKRGAFQNISAHSINLGNNGIRWLEEGCFEDLHSLDAVDLEYNKIEALPKFVFRNLKNLTIASVAHNDLNQFDQDWFFGTPKLEYLFLNDNRLRNIPKAAFSKLINLKALTLEKNWIDYVDRYAFEGVNTLNELYLGNNRIKYLHLDLSNTRSLRTLTIDSNQLTYIPLIDLKDVESCLQNIWVHGNPWQCQCFDEMLEWTNTHNIKMLWRCRGVDLFCYIPQNYSDQCRNRTDTSHDENFLEYFVQDCKNIIH